MFKKFESRFQELTQKVALENPDPSHDYAHVLRVVKLAKALAESEGANLDVVVPAAYLHDIVFVSKTDSRRKMASQLSAQKALSILCDLGYPNELQNKIAHAIAAHSFSAGIVAETLEAKIVQDSDRLDGLGAIGIARCFGLSGLIKRPFYNLHDPFCTTRTPDDQTNSLDHFFVKLFKTAENLNTASARLEGQRRLKFMKEFVRQLENEIA